MGKVKAFSAIDGYLLFALAFLSFGKVNGTAKTTLPFPGEFFDGIGYDLTTLSWNHGIRSYDEMKNAFCQEETMLVVDVYTNSLLSLLPTKPVVGFQGSNLTFENFLTELISFNSNNNKTYQKGLKVQFPHQRSVEPVLRILKSKLPEIEFPVILHADILQGPGYFCNSIRKNNPLEPQEFMKLVKELMPAASLSLGWTTGDLIWPSSGQVINDELTIYTFYHIMEMYEAITESGLNLTAIEVTISVRSPFAVGVEKNFAHLLKKLGPYATLTLWALNEDVVWTRTTARFISVIGKSRIYADFEDSWFRRLSLGLDLYSPKHSVINLRSNFDDPNKENYNFSIFAFFLAVIMAIVVLINCCCTSVSY